MAHRPHLSLSLSLSPSLSQAQKLKHIHSCFGLKNCFKVRVVVGVCVAASVVEGLLKLTLKSKNLSSVYE